MERASRDTRHTMMAPFRFTAQWALFPLLAAFAVLLGAGLGSLSSWLTTHPSSGDMWLRQVFLSPLPIIVVIAILGLATNSWTIGILTGALTSVSAFCGHELAEARWSTTSVVNAQDLVIGCSLALIAGGMLGLGACIWHHEAGMTQALGAGLLGGALAWSGWQDLAPSDWARDTQHLVGWISLALAAVVILRCRSLGSVVLAACCAIAVVWIVSFVDGGERLDMRSIVHDIRHGMSDLMARAREAIRR